MERLRLALFSAADDVVIAIVPAGSDGLAAVKHAVLKRDHHAVQLAEERHQLRDAQLFA